MTAAANQIWGIDPYCGGRRKVSWEIFNGHVVLRAAGDDGDGAAMLTPSQVKDMALHLTRAAEAAEADGAVTSA